MTDAIDAVLEEMESWEEDPAAAAALLRVLHGAGVLAGDRFAQCAARVERRAQRFRRPAPDPAVRARCLELLAQTDGEPRGGLGPDLGTAFLDANLITVGDFLVLNDDTGPTPWLDLRAVGVGPWTGDRLVVQWAARFEDALHLGLRGSGLRMDGLRLEDGTGTPYAVTSGSLGGERSHVVFAPSPPAGALVRLSIDRRGVELPVP